MNDCVLYYLVTAIVLGFGFGMFYIADIKAAKRRQDYLDSIKKRVETCEQVISTECKTLNEMCENIGLKPVQVQKPLVERFGNCPNCGAPVTGNKCEYCGTVFNHDDNDYETLYADNVPVIRINKNRSQCNKEKLWDYPDIFF